MRLESAPTFAASAFFRTAMGISLGILVVTGLAAPVSTAANTLNRNSDPVVMDGSQLPRLAGVEPTRILGFKFESGWVRINVQVDERAVIDYGVVYDSLPSGLTTLAYTDTGTFAGPDPDTTFDADDELVFMAKDAGGPVPSGTADPSFVVLGSRVEVVITDPITLNSAYVYLFQWDGSTSYPQNDDYVGYDFVLLSGPYLTTYNTMTGPNPENSVVGTEFYRTHFSDRWIRDETNIYAGEASGDNILDRHKNLFAPDNCGRSEDTFSNGEGAFFANIGGPVRAIRSYLGANSGPLTQRDHFFYETRHDVHTYLRVHAISGVMDFYDYSPAASGLVYTNDLNTGGVDIDGSPIETVVPGPIVWEMVTGVQGTLIHASSVETDIPAFSYTSYYLDDASPSTPQCTGDDHAYGSSGLWINQAIPNTDPGLGAHNTLAVKRIVYVEPPDQTTALAAQRYNQAVNPLTTSVSPPTAVEGLNPALGYHLSQNSPNPFSAATRIHFHAPPGQQTGVRVYDVSGKLVRMLFDGWSGGVVAWDGTNADGRRVVSGVYFYQLKSGRFTQTRKMVLLD